MKEYVQYSKEIADEICNAIATSEKSVRQLCRENPHFPDRLNIRRWCIAYPEFRNQYARAKADQVEWLVEQALEIAYDSSDDVLTDENGRERCNHEFVSRSRLKIDTIKWIACKLAPKIYGDKLQVEQDNSAAEELKKAIAIVSKLKDGDNGRSSSTES